MIKPTILLLSTLLLLNKASAQTPPPPEGEAILNVTSHNGASPQGGQVYNTDLYTGTTSINIPINNYSVDDLDIGVSLGYSTNGIKVDQIASTVGMGWDINGLSYIQREANDLEDEVCIMNPANNAVVRRGAWNAGEGALNNDYPSKNHDVFTACLSGRIIKFSIEASGNHDTMDDYYQNLHVRYVTMPLSNIKIELWYGNYPVRRPINMVIPDADYRAYRFVITDEEGNVYNFNKIDYENKSVKVDNTHWYAYLVNTKWWASTITTKTGAVVQYSYNNQEVNYPICRDEEVTEAYYYHTEYSGGSYTSNGREPIISTKKAMCNGLVETISQIIYPNGTKVDFLYRNTTRRDLPDMKILESINVKGGYESNQNTISYLMSQSYMYSDQSSGFVALDNQSSTNDLKYRLFLNSIDRQVNGNNTAKERYYTFTYNENSLPSRLSPAQDYYGYYNHGTTYPPYDHSNETPGETPAFALPFHDFSWDDGQGNHPHYSYGTIKTPDINYMQYGILKKVKNALGGEFELFYDAPESLQNPPDPESKATYPTGESSSVNTFDGLRTQKIEYRDGVTSANNRTTTYTYPTNGGYRFYSRLYFWYPINVGGVSNETTIVRKWSNNPVHPTNYYNGSNHGYSDVVETQSGASEILSKTQYHFTNIAAGIDEPQFRGVGSLGYASRIDVTRLSQMHLTNVADIAIYQLGHPLTITHYTGNSTTPDNITQNEYEVVQTNLQSYQLGASTYPYSVFPEIHSDFHATGESDYINNKANCNALPGTIFRLKKATSTTYSGATQLQDIKEYEYTDGGYISKTKWKDSKGDHYYTRTGYYFSTSFKYPVTWGTYLETGTGDDWALSYQEITSFAVGVPYLVNATSSIKAAGGMQSSYTHNFAKPDKEFTLRDNKHNVLEIKYEDGLRYSSNMWDTRIGEKVVEVANAHYADIAYTGFEGFSIATTTVNADDNGKWSFTAADVIKGGNGNPLAVTGKYLYRLKSTNSLSVTIPDPAKSYVLSFWSTGVNVTYNGNAVSVSTPKIGVGGINLHTAIIPGNPFLPSGSYQVTITANNGFIDEARLYPVGAAMTTYAYDPLFGLSSQCDAQNNVTTMEYDGQGRLWRVKDVKGSILSQTNTSIQGANN